MEFGSPSFTTRHAAVPLEPTWKKKAIGEPRYERSSMALPDTGIAKYAPLLLRMQFDVGFFERHAVGANDLC